MQNISDIYYLPFNFEILIMIKAFAFESAVKSMHNNVSNVIIIIICNKYK